MIRKIIRIHQKNSAFVYAILESLEGYCSFSTLDPQEGEDDQMRCLELWIVPELEKEVNAILNGMRKKFPIFEAR